MHHMKDVCTKIDTCTLGTHVHQSHSKTNLEESLHASTITQVSIICMEKSKANHADNRPKEWKEKHPSAASNLEVHPRLQGTYPVRH